MGRERAHRRWGCVVDAVNDAALLGSLAFLVIGVILLMIWKGPK